MTAGAVGTVAAVRGAPRRGRRPLAALVLAAALASGGLAGCGSDEGGAAATSPPTSAAGAGAAAEVVKDVLAVTDDPPGAPGRTLTLIRYTIPAGAKLAPHVHPGVQLARITDGTLTYTVVEGTAAVRRAGAEADEEVRGPATVELGPGDAVAERDGMVHYGENRTDAPVVIEATLLTRTGEDLAVPVTTTTTTTAPG